MIFKLKFAHFAVLLTVCLSVATQAFDERVDTVINWKIRREATTNSRIMNTLHHLTDVYGPRLTGSPNHEASARWAVEQMEAWGLTNGHLEPWDFGHPGWLNERMTAHLLAPVKDPLVAEVLAWTPSTEGPVRATVYQLILPDRLDEAKLVAHLDDVADDVAGKIVLVGEANVVPVTIDGPPRRRD